MPWPPRKNRGAQLAGDEPAPLKSAALGKDDKSQITRPALRRSRRPPGPGEIAAARELRRQGLHLKLIEAWRP